MKSAIIAFAAGALVAGGTAYIALKKEAPVTQVSTVSTPPPTPAEAPQPPVPEPVAAPSSPAVIPQKPSAFRQVKPRPAKAVTAQVTPPAAMPAPVPEPPPAPVKQPEPVAAPAPVPAPAPKNDPVVFRPTEPAKPPEPNRVTIPAGTTLAVRLIDTVSSERADTGQTFHATLDQPLIVDGFAIAERGARVEGRVVSSEQAGRVRGTAHLSIELVRLVTADGQRVAISTQTFEKEGEESKKSDAAKVAAGAGVGAALGAIFGGGKGAAIGAASGAGAGTGVVLATRGKPVILPAETRISFRLKSAVTVTEKR